MNKKLDQTLQEISMITINGDRKTILSPFVSYLKQKLDSREIININFICTHNSRRSHLAQVWMKTLANHFKIDNIQTYSGGTEATAVATQVIEILKKQGFTVDVLSKDENPVYAIKYDENSHPIIGFSKKYDHSFNPSSNFAAVMTCSQADEGCPFVSGSEQRIAVTYEDPKIADNTAEELQTYLNRSNQIASEFYYIFSQLNL